jgi:hypothetical protein
MTNAPYLGYRETKERLSIFTPGVDTLEMKANRLCQTFPTRQVERRVARSAAVESNPNNEGR